MRKDKGLWPLFSTFFKMGAVTFGGGYAMLPILTREIAEHHGWATEEELLEYYAIGQATPGIIAVNTAGFIGYKKAGAIGAVVATLGLVCPSILVISLIYPLIHTLRDRFFYAMILVKTTVTALIIHTLWQMFAKVWKVPKKVIVVLVSILAVAVLDIGLPMVIGFWIVVAVLECLCLRFSSNSSK